MSNHELHELECRNCGANLDCHDGDRVLACAYCGSKHVLGSGKIKTMRGREDNVEGLKQSFGGRRHVKDR